MNYLVIYYDGNDHKAKFAESEYPNSSAPHIWGLTEECFIVAVIGGEHDLEGRLDVWIDEELVIEKDGV